MKKLLFILAVFVLLWVSVFISLKFSNKKIILSPVPIPKAVVPKLVPVRKGELGDVIAKTLEGKNGKYAVVVKNLTTGEAYSLNENEVFKTASLYKLWVMAVVFDQIEKGQLREDEVISQDAGVLNSEFGIEEEFVEMTEGVLSMTVSDALLKMIVYSQNPPALLLTDKVTVSAISDFLQRNKFAHSSLGDPPQTTAGDIALFFEKLYKVKLANVATTKEMMGLLGQQARNNKLPKYLPEEVTIAHKTGELGTFSHDGGIVFGPKDDWIIVVMSDYGIPVDAEEEIAQISKAVWQFFNQ